jgi:amidase
MWVQGPLARSIADLRLGLQAMSRADSRDAWHAPVPLTGEPLKKPIRVGLVRGSEIVKPHAGVNEALDRAAKWLGDAGYIVEEIAVPEFEEAYRLWYLLCLEELRPHLPLMDKEGDDGIRGAIRTYYESARQWWAQAPTLVDYMNGYARRGTLIARMQKLFENYPILLTPVSAEPAFEQDADFLSLDRGKQVVRANWPLMAIPMLALPGLSAPVHLSNGLPVGVQLVGRRFREDVLLEAGEIIEARTEVKTPIDPR